MCRLTHALNAANSGSLTGWFQASSGDNGFVGGVGVAATGFAFAGAVGGNWLVAEGAGADTVGDGVLLGLELRRARNTSPDNTARSRTTLILMCDGN